LLQVLIITDESDPVQEEKAGKLCISAKDLTQFHDVLNCM